MHFPYTDKVLEHFQNPRNVGKMENPDAKAIEGSPACGDMVAIYLKVDAEKKRIDDIRFESYGCASNIATGSIITEMAKGKTLDEARAITWKQAADELGGLPPIKTHCSVLAVEGLRSAIDNYEETHGIIRERRSTDREIVEHRLKHVMNPVKGLDIIRTGLVREIDLENGTATVTVGISADHQFAASIRGDIEEKLRSLWDIKNVVVLHKCDHE